MFGDNTPRALVDIATQAETSNRILAQINDTLRSITRLSSGSFTMAAAASLVVADTNITATSVVVLQDTNSHAADLQAGAKRIYVSAKTAGASFTVATQDGNAAVGDETFSYLVFNPQ